MHHWHAEFQFFSDSLRRFDLVPCVLEWVMACGVESRHRHALDTVLTELVSNALEHGVLGLNSDLKTTYEGFSKYYEERQERLSDLKSGWIRLALGYQKDTEGNFLECSVEDSGLGFDYQGVLSRPLVPQTFRGRGCLLVASLCEKFDYVGPGNLVRIVYRC